MRSAFASLGLLGLLASPVVAQVAPVLRGTLRDSLGRAVPMVEVSHQRVSTLTDSAGNFRLSPVPTGRISVRFAKGGVLIGNLDAFVTEDTMPNVLVEVVSVSDEPRTFFGVVTDSSGAPIRDATVEVVTEMIETRTDSLGRFAIRNLSPTRHLVRVRRVGVSPTFLSIDLTDSTSRRARIVLRQYAGQNLGLVVVNANMVPARLRGFQSRVEKKSGWGRYITENEIAVRNPFRTTELFQAVPGVRVNLDRRGGGVLTGRGGCLMSTFINGAPAAQLRGSGLDDIITPRDIIGIEIYNGLGGVPPELMFGVPNACGTVGIWTK